MKTLAPLGVALLLTGLTTPALAQSYNSGTQYTWGDARPASSVPAMSNENGASSDVKWTGVYGGLVFGGAFGTSNKINSSGEAGDFQVQGVEGGLELGYNYEYRRFVFGIEADVTGNSITGQHGCVDATLQCETDSQWSVTLRPRLGYSYGKFMPYMTAGLAIGDVRSQHYNSNNVVDLTNESTQLGFVGGAGFEYQFQRNWSLKTEYLYTQYEDAHHTSNTGASYTVPLDENIIRFGLNYRLPR